MKNSMKIRLRVVHDGAERTLVAGPKAIYNFETSGAGVSIGQALAEVRVEHWARLAYQAALVEAQRGDGPPVKPFDAWIDGLEDIEVLAAEDDPVPLDGTP